MLTKVYFGQLRLHYLALDSIRVVVLLPAASFDTQPHLAHATYIVLRSM